MSIEPVTAFAYIDSRGVINADTVCATELDVMIIVINLVTNMRPASMKFSDVKATFEKVVNIAGVQFRDGAVVPVNITRMLN